VALEANSKFEEAAEEYQAAARSRPGWIEPINNLGIIAIKQQKPADAIAFFNKILDSDPFNAEALNNIGVVLQGQGKFAEAIDHYRKALESNPKYVKAVINLERALEDGGNLKDAQVELEKLVKLAPRSAEIRNRLAGFYLKTQRYSDAEVQAKEALEWDPENIITLKLLGTAYRMQGEEDAAKQIFERILTLDPGNYSFHLDLEDIYHKKNEYA
jgi:tetratricopeptide (TPR) repeat protein